MESLDQRFEKLDNASRTGYLIAGFITRTLTLEEEEELDQWILQREENMQLFEDMTDDSKVEEFMRWIARRNTEARLAATKSRLKFGARSISVRWWHYAAAACVLALAGIFLVTRYGENRREPVSQPLAQVADIEPGAAAAILRLPGGRVIRLDSISDTTVNNIHIENAGITYGSGSPDDTAMHEIIIPRKGFYKVQLPDGTDVWLNNESSIRYPGRFSGGTREVFVTGETYFEVAKDASRPFIVHAGNTRIRAVGTAFNVNGFDQMVTLTEGIVEVHEGEMMKRLKPGEQLLPGGKVREVDVSPVIAWKENKFKFKNTPLRDIMPMLERWYDCTVYYEASIDNHFNGTIDRSVPVSRVLQLLEGTGQVHFIIDKNVITVKK